VTQHVQVCPGCPDASGPGEPAQAPGGCVAVHPGAAAVDQDRAVRASAYGPVDGAPDGGGSGIRTILVPLPHTRSTRWPCSSPRSAMSAAVASKIRRPRRPEHGYQCEVAGIG
jgi:hypothetical protein